MQRTQTHPGLLLCCTATLLAALLPVTRQAMAQAAKPASTSPASAKPSAPPLALDKPISSDNLTERGYTDGWPKPSYPSTDREKKQFTVEYVYRYAQSDYNPPVTVPQITHAQSQNDTPEHTFLAFMSALKSQDYDWWLSLWDTRSQQMFRDEAVAKKQDAAFFKALWQQQFAGRPVTLVSRLETVGDIVLEYRLGVAAQDKPAPLYPAPMRNENGKWVLTRELSDQAFVPFLGQQTISGPLDFEPAPGYTGRPQLAVVTQSQQIFFRNVGKGTSSATSFPW